MTRSVERSTAILGSTSWHYYVIEIHDLLLPLFGNQNIVFVKRDRDRKKRPKTFFYLNEELSEPLGMRRGF
jgi:hypothetical protein